MHKDRTEGWQEWKTGENNIGYLCYLILFCCAPQEHQEVNEKQADCQLKIGPTLRSWKLLSYQIFLLGNKDQRDLHPYPVVTLTIQPISAQVVRDRHPGVNENQ